MGWLLDVQGGRSTVKGENMSDTTALLIAVVSLCSTGHFIDAAVLAVWLVGGLVAEARDPLGIMRTLRSIQSYRG